MHIDSATRSQIIVGHDTLGLTPEQIAEQLDIDLDAVQYVLMTNKPKPADFDSNLTATGNSDLSLDGLLNEYRLLAKFSKNDSVKEKALRNLINEMKGRNDIDQKSLELKQRMMEKGGDQDERIKKFNVLVLQMNSPNPKPTLDLDVISEVVNG